MQIKDYSIEFADNEIELSQKVSQSIRDGWQPFGNPSAIYNPELKTATYFQAIVYYG